MSVGRITSLSCIWDRIGREYIANVYFSTYFQQNMIETIHESSLLEITGESYCIRVDCENMCRSGGRSGPRN